jgi:hypothetical protein
LKNTNQEVLSHTIFLEDAIQEVLGRTIFLEFGTQEVLSHTIFLEGIVQEVLCHTISFLEKAENKSLSNACFCESPKEDVGRQNVFCVLVA